MRRAACLLILAAFAPPSSAAWRHWTDFTDATGLCVADGNPVLATTRGGVQFDPATAAWRHYSLGDGLWTMEMADVCTDGQGMLFWAGRDGSLSAHSSLGEGQSRGLLELRDHPDISTLRDLWGGDGGLLAVHDLGVSRMVYLPESDEFRVEWTARSFGDLGGQATVLGAAPLGDRLVVVTDQGLAVGTGYPDAPGQFATLTDPGGNTPTTQAWLATDSGHVMVMLQGSDGDANLLRYEENGEWVLLRTDLGAPLALAAGGGHWAVATASGSNTSILLDDGRMLAQEHAVGAMAYAGDTLWVAFRPDQRGVGGLAAWVDGQQAGSWTPDVPGAEDYVDVDFAPDGAVWVAGAAASLARNGIHRFQDNQWTNLHPGYSRLANYPTSICCDRQGGVWVGSWGAGCSRYEPANSTWLTFDENASAHHVMAGYGAYVSGSLYSDPNFPLVTDIEQDDAGNVWIVNHQALDDSCLVAVPAAWFSDTSTAFTRLTYAQGGQSFPLVLRVSPYSGVWLGVGGKDNHDMGKRILRLNSRNLPVNRLSEWRTETYDLADAIWNFDVETTGAITGLAEDGQGNIWIGTDAGFYMGGLYGGVAQFSRVQYIEGLLSEEESSVSVDGRGRVWLGSDEGLNVFEPAAGVFRQPAAADELNELLGRMEGITIRAAKAHPTTGELWVATNVGLFTNTEGARDYGSSPAGTVRMYPNPFRPDGERLARVKPEGLANGGRLSIYDAAGSLVRSLDLLDAERGWDGRDEDGELVPSGVYLLLVTSDGGSAEGKVAVIR